jgi:peptidoglycan-associated lipoprotein
MALILMLALAAGCGGGGDEVETDPAADMGEETTETVPPPVVPEETQPVEETPDYASMEPAEFGVEDVFFCFDCYDLDDAALATLSRNARILRDTGVMILVSGHTDERGTVEYNLALGERRANAVKDYLVSLGVSAAKIRTTSYGESRPFAFGSNEDAWAQNRRVHFERP